MQHGNAVKITLLDVDNADVQDITNALEGSPAGLIPEKLPGDRYGDPGTIALALVVAQPVILALAAWILKRRRKQRIEIRGRVLYTDGTEVERSVTVTISESEAPDAAVIKQLVEGFDLAAGPLTQALDGTGGVS
jgi:hypothetical protein